MYASFTGEFAKAACPAQYIITRVPPPTHAHSLCPRRALFASFNADDFAKAACPAGASFGVPRNGYENGLLQAALGSDKTVSV